MTDTPDPASVLGRPGQAYEAARLRWASSADTARLVALWREAYPGEEAQAEELRAWIARGGALLLEGRQGEVLAALPWREADGGWQVERVATLPSERGQGYGRWLMTKVEALAIKANVPYLWLRLPDDDEAADQLAYYGRMGYTEHERAGESITLRKRVGGVWQTKAPNGASAAGTAVKVP